jgi:DNA-binding transcriptional MerR regulator
MKMDPVLKNPTKSQADVDGKGSKGISSGLSHEQQLGPSESALDRAMLTIGKVAKMAEVTADTVRYYEKEGLITPVQKSDAGYRLYNADAVRRLNFIKHAQQCGLSLLEIREFLELKKRAGSCCNDVRTVALHKKLQLESKIKALQTMSTALGNLLDSCTDEDKPLEECPHLECLGNKHKEHARQKVPRLWHVKYSISHLAGQHYLAKDGVTQFDRSVNLHEFAVVAISSDSCPV